VWQELLHQNIFFLKHAGELRIFVLRREDWPITITNHPPWAIMGDGRTKHKKKETITEKK